MKIGEAPAAGIFRMNCAECFPRFVYSRRLVLKRIILAVILFSLSFNSGSEVCAGKPSVTVVFRYDDCSAVSPTDFEMQLIRMFEKYGFPCSFGIIPFRYVGEGAGLKIFPPEKAGVFKEAVQSGTLEIAAHGYSHQPLSNENRSEFSGVDYQTQAEKIRSGKEYLEKIFGVRVNTFMPPYNSCDLNTVRALEDSGFVSLSAWGDPVAEASALKFIPGTCHKLGMMKAAVEAERNAPVPKPVVFIFHAFDFLDVNPGKGNYRVRDFEDFLIWLKAQNDVCVKTLDQVAGTE